MALPNSFRTFLSTWDIFLLDFLDMADYTHPLFTAEHTETAQGRNGIRVLLLL